MSPRRRTADLLRIAAPCWAVAPRKRGMTWQKVDVCERRASLRVRVPRSVRPRSRHRQDDDPGRPAPDFPWSWPLPQEIVLKRRSGSSDFSIVATTARDTQRDLLHYVIETQRLVNVLPAAGTDRAIGIVLDRVRTVTNADGAAVEVAEGNVMVHRSVSGLRTEPEGSRTSADTGLSGPDVRVGMPLLCRGHRCGPPRGRPRLSPGRRALHCRRPDVPGR